MRRAVRDCRRGIDRLRRAHPTVVTALIGSAAMLFAIERSVSIFGYLYPHAFGWRPSDVRSPDAPDTLLSLILSLAIAFGLCMVGLLISLFVFPAARGPALRTKIDD